jgi:hypothetical protein
MSSIQPPSRLTVSKTYRVARLRWTPVTAVIITKPAIALLRSANAAFCGDKSSPVWNRLCD